MTSPVEWLLVQACSKTKTSTNELRPAIEVYDGFFFKIIKKAMREDQMSPTIRTTILSSKHGLIDLFDPIGSYDQHISEGRANELNAHVPGEILSIAEDIGRPRVVVNVGRDYRPALVGLDSMYTGETLEIPTRRIGRKGQVLKDFIRKPRAELLDPFCSSDS